MAPIVLSRAVVHSVFGPEAGTVLDLPMTTWVARRLPAIVPGAMLHRAALAAMRRGRYALAEALFERAAERYRLDLEVQPLARLRVHQAIARIRAAGIRELHSAACLDVEQRLARLEEIESLDPPHALIPASRLLASWIASPETPREPSTGHAIRDAA
jgi:hypothetical protein